MTLERMLHYKNQLLELEPKMIEFESLLSSLHHEADTDPDLTDEERMSVQNLRALLPLRASVKARLHLTSVQDMLALLKEHGYDSIDDVPVTDLPGIAAAIVQEVNEMEFNNSSLDGVEP